MNTDNEMRVMGCEMCEQYFQDGKDFCKKCGFDLNSFNKIEDDEEEEPSVTKCFYCDAETECRDRCGLVPICDDCEEDMEDDGCICEEDKNGDIIANENCEAHDCCKFCSKCVKCKFNGMFWWCAVCEKERNDEIDNYTDSDDDDEEEEPDIIGAYMGDIYGCSDRECEKCVKCNPLLWWLKKRIIPRPDKAQEVLKEITEYKNKYGVEEVKNLNSFKNGLKYELINVNCELCVVV